MRLLKWLPGRQGGGYLKSTLWQIGKTDGYVIYYPPRTGIAWHKDPVPEHRHYRLNITLWPWFKGQKCILKGFPLFRFGPLLLFRPDLVMHRVLEITEQSRYVLSIGWARRVVG